MSTQGVFILKKGGVEKGIRISHDAYPDGVGIDVIDLLKTTDMPELYNCLVSSDEADLPSDEIMPSCEEEISFSFGILRLVVKQQKRIRVSPDESEMIRNSL